MTVFDRDRSGDMTPEQAELPSRPIRLPVGSGTDLDLHRSAGNRAVTSIFRSSREASGQPIIDRVRDNGSEVSPTVTSRAPEAQTAGGLTGLVLALQRSAGNRAVTSVVQRHAVVVRPEDVPSDPSVEAAAPDAPAPKPVDNNPSVQVDPAADPGDGTTGPQGGGIGGGEPIGELAEGMSADTEADTEEAPPAAEEKEQTVQTLVAQRDGSNAPQAGTIPNAVTGILNKSAWGRHALDVQQKYSVVIEMANSGVAKYDSGTNHCTINTTMAPALIAGYFVHEMNHAEMNKTGKSAQADTAPDRDAYVTKMVEEEITGTVRQFEAALESMPPGPGVSLQGSGMEHEADYRRVYIYWHDKAVSEGKSEAEAMAQGKAYGAKRTRLFIQPQNPRDLGGLGPDPNSTYADYYRRQWDRAHRTRP
jgi:hypothetical protein